MADHRKQNRNDNRTQFEEDLASLNRMLTDPLLRSVMRRAIIGEQQENSAKPKPPSGTKPETHNRNQGRLKHRGAVQLTGLTSAVNKAVGAMHGKFDAYAVIDAMEKDGYKFKTKNKRIGVLRVLQGIANQGRIELIEKGRSGHPGVYRPTA
jgi:hypothetical protein